MHLLNSGREYRLNITVERLLKKSFFILFLYLTPYLGLAQITTGSLEGFITDENNEQIAFANVLAIHTPTGTQYGTNSMANGRFVMDNLKPGGPYLLSISYLGYKDFKQDDIYVTLGQVTSLEIAMQASSTTLEAVEVIYDKNDPFANNKNGIYSNLDEQAIASAPSLNRSLQDVTRLVPQGGQSSFGGANYRYNNLSIDGASNNDVLGFQEPASGAAGSVASGTPGALAGTQPISLDAIQEVQVALAPFDVQQGNFTGASINAVTRSGTNTLQGSAYFFGRNQSITGKSIDEKREPIADYHDFQTGFRLGGPLLKNKVFFFANYEKAIRNEPVLNAPGSAGTQISAEIAQAISDTLLSRYGFDAGTYGDFIKERKSDKYLIRFDFNLNPRHQLTVRDNYVIASSDNLDRGSSFLNFGSQGFTHHSQTNSLVVELNSRISDHLYNHLTIGYNTVNDKRSYEGMVFPHLEITYNTANTIFAGTYREASLYGLTLNTTQITDKLQFYKGKHTFTLGTNNDLYHIQYRFLTAWNGRWAYKSLDNFFNDQPSRVRGVYNYTDNSFDFNLNEPSADFKLFLLSVYGQDQYRMNDRFSVTAGLRIDMQLHPEKVPINEKVVNTPEFAHFDNHFGGIPQLNPRLAFNYQVNDDKTIQIRGGTGLFTGRIPFAWYAYSHYISGHQYGNIDLRPTSPLPITTDLSDLQSFQPDLTEINLVDNDFKLPRVWRSSIGVDIKTANEWQFSFEAMYSKSLTDIWFKSINLKDATATYQGADNRPYFLGSGDEKKINPSFTNVFLLTNTDKGYSYFLTASVNKKLTKNMTFFTAYTYGESKDVMNGVRNSMAANFNWNQAVDSNNPELSWSNFDVRHRIVSTFSYGKNIGKNQHFSLNLIYTARSGQPFSYTLAGDINRDGSSKNDLFFVPATQDQILLKDILNSNGDLLTTADEQWQQLDDFITSDDYLNSRRGNYAQRNGARAPWNHLLDLRMAHHIQLDPKKTSKQLEITLDIINFLNFIHHSWGWQRYVPNVKNSSYQLIDFIGSENGIPAYQFKNPQGTPWQTDPLNSRWQAQIGLRYSW